MFAATIGTASVRSERRIGPSRSLFFGDATPSAYSFDYWIATEGKGDNWLRPYGFVWCDARLLRYVRRHCPAPSRNHRGSAHDRPADPQRDPHRRRTGGEPRQGGPAADRAGAAARPRRRTPPTSRAAGRGGGLRHRPRPATSDRPWWSEQPQPAS